MEANSACYRAAIALSAAEAAAGLAKFLQANRNQLLKVKGGNSKW
jgi:hypothetical protein